MVEGNTEASTLHFVLEYKSTDGKPKVNQDKSLHDGGIYAWGIYDVPAGVQSCCFLQNGGKSDREIQPTPYRYTLRIHFIPTMSHRTRDFSSSSRMAHSACLKIS